MSRYFSIDGEMNRVDAHLVEEGAEWGTEVRWRRYEPESPKHNVYDVGSPRAWSKPIDVPVLWALRTEGRNTFREEGLHTRDSLQFALAKRVIRDRLGWESILTREGHEAFLRDRIEYEGRLFTINDIQVQGQLEDRDVVVGVICREVREGEEWLDTLPEEEGSPDPVYD